MYKHFLKRLIGFLGALVAVILLSPLFIVVIIWLHFANKGAGVFYYQTRIGKGEKPFNVIKFKSMTDERDENGELLPDDKRLPAFGAWLRKTSLDELPEAFSILKGDMSIIGPRPQLVRDMVFMSDKQRMRHTAKPGLSGLAQVRGRNAITWEEKLDWDLKYIKRVSFLRDLKLVIETIKVALVKQEGITDGENATALDYGDALLKDGKVSGPHYDNLQVYAKKLITEHEKGKR